jgi:hypothetical protein
MLLDLPSGFAEREPMEGYRGHRVEFERQPAHSFPMT